MADDFGLLFDAVTFERPTGFQAIIIAAKGMALQRQENALLMLPDMHQFMDEKPLQSKIAVAEIIAE